MTDPELLKHITYLLETARVAWDARRDFRVRRARSRDFYRNRPNDLITDPDTGEQLTEEQYLANRGQEPIRINQIRPVVMSLKGQFRMNKTQRLAFGRNRDDAEAAEMMTEAVRAVLDINRAEEADADEFEESLISGLYGWKTGYKWFGRYQRPDVAVEPVDPVTLILPLNISDRRLEDIKIIGQVHDLDLDEVVSQFAKSPKDAKRIENIYQRARDQVSYSISVGFANKDAFDFFQPTDPFKCRVYEIWAYEYGWQTFIHDTATATYGIQDVSDEDIEEENAQRLILAQQSGEMPPLVRTLRRYEGRWRVYYLTPTYELLHFSDNPYWHKQHPFDVGFANFFDGEIWGMVEDVIDQQRLINRLTTSLEQMWSTSAKGVLMVPEGAIPDGMSPQDFASEWSKFNGVITYKAKQGVQAPYQVTSNSVPAGVINWLANLRSDLREVSGVSGATQGLEPQPGTPATLYQQQVIQAQLTNRDYFDTFFAIRKQRDLKVVQLIAQYYEEPRYIAVAGRRMDGSKAIIYNPSRVRDMEYDLTMSESPDTPAHRAEMEEYLTGLLTANRLTFRQYLQVSSNPKADMLLQLIDTTNPLLGDQQMNPQAVAQLQMGAQAGDPDAIALLTQAQ